MSGAITPWPRLMRAETASRYVDETSVQAFRRRVGTVWPFAVRGNDRNGIERTSTRRWST